MTEKGIAPYQQPVGAQDEEREGTESFWSEKDCGHLPMAPTHPAPKTPARPAPGPAVRAADTAPRARVPRPRSPPRTRVCPAASSRRLLLPAACVLFSARTGTRFPRDAPGGQGGRRRRLLRPPFTPTSEAADPVGARAPAARSAQRRGPSLQAGCLPRALPPARPRPPPWLQAAQCPWAAGPSRSGPGGRAQRERLSGVSGALSAPVEATVAFLLPSADP